MIGVHFDGRPISSDAADRYLDAILEAWSPAETGAEAVVSALLGEYNPGGKLPVSVAYHTGQIPIYYNHPYGSAWHQGESIGFVNYVDLPHTPRYFFGHGLSYTTFRRLTIMSKLTELANAVEKGKSKLVPGLVQEALDKGNSPLDILNQGMIDAMGVVGEKFKAGEIFVPEMLVAARAMKKGVEVLKPHLGNASEHRIGKMAMGTVFGDLHDIGKNLVIMMIESSGYEVVDLGIDVPVEKFREAADDPEITVIGISALLTTTMEAMRDVVADLNKHSRRSQFKIMVGGAPITDEFAKEIGADIYTEDAASAGQAAKALAGR